MKTRFKPLATCALALAAMAFKPMCSTADTYYKVLSDGLNRTSFYGSYFASNKGEANYNKNVGWGTRSGTTTTVIKPFSIAEHADSDYVIETGLAMRTTDSGGDETFGGRSLLLDGGQIVLKNKDGATVTIPNLSFKNGSITAGTGGNYDITLAGAFSIEANSAATFSDNINGASITVKAAGAGDATTVINANLKTEIIFEDLGSFLGTLNATVAAGSPALTLAGPFGGRIGTVSGSAQLRVNYDGLPTDAGLKIESYAPSAALKSNLVFFSPTADFNQAGLKILTFPEGAGVNVTDFRISCATSPSGTAAELALEQITNVNGTVSFVTRSGRAHTFYKVGNDPQYSTSFGGNVNASCGWSVNQGAATTTPCSSADMCVSDFIVDESKWLRTAEGASDETFAGLSLKLTGGGEIWLKNKSGSTITIPNLIFDDGVVAHQSQKYIYTLAGAFSIVAGSSAVFSGNDSGGALTIAATGQGDATTSILANLYSSPITFADLEEFGGTLEVTASAGKTPTLTLAGPFGGRIGSLPDAVTLCVNYGGLPEGRGLSVTNVADALKANVQFKFFGQGTDFSTDNLPLLRFPSGTVIEDPNAFSVAYAASSGDAGARIATLKTFVDEDDGNAVVLAVDAVKPCYAKMVDDGSGAFSWRFYTFDWRDLTQTCGLTAPDDSITVYFGSTAEFEAIKAAVGRGACAPADYVMTALTVSDDADLTSGGFTFSIADGQATIDLAGHKVAIPVSFFNTSMTFTDSVCGGELRVDVPSGSTIYNKTVTLTGSLKFVKGGAGTLVAEKQNQSYTGGTEVLAGILTTPSQSSQSITYSAKKYFFGAYESEIRVDADGVFNIAGNYDYYFYHLVLDGGTLHSSTLTGGLTDQTITEYGSLGWLTLTADSSLYIRGCVVFSGGKNAIDLGGHEFTIDCSANQKWIHWRKDIENGTLYLKGREGFSNGNTELRILQPINASAQPPTVDVIDGFGITMSAEFNVRGYRPIRTWDNPSCTGTAALNVYGTFRPDSDYFYGCTMQDGSTIDLSGKNGVWPTTSNATKGLKTVTFADNATVTIDFGEREVNAIKVKVIDWSGHTPTNLASLKFKLKDGQSGALVKKDDGLYLLRGMIVVFW